MRVALVQFAPGPNKWENLRRLTKILSELPNGVDLAVLPEFCMGTPENGPNREYVEENAEDLEGTFVSALKEKCREKGMWIIANVFERYGVNEYYDTNVALNEDGEVVAVYRKVHLFDALGYKESRVFRAGDAIATFEFRDRRVGMAICFDVRFPEIFRKMALMGAELFIVSSAWYKGPNKEWQWKLMCAARASENVAYLVGVNNASKPFVGDSIVVDPYGSITLELGSGEDVRVVELNMEEVRTAREKLPLLELRRPSLYNLV